VLLAQVVWRIFRASLVLFGKLRAGRPGEGGGGGGEDGTGGRDDVGYGREFSALYQKKGGTFFARSKSMMDKN
jgi:hypothetical protein